MIALAPARFPKTARVRSRAAYARVFENARRIHHPALTLHVAPAATEDDGATLGLAVSRKVDGRAVGRNRIKRIWRETFRLHRDQLAPRSLVVVAKPAAAKLHNEALMAALLDSLRRAGALPRGDATGTMPDSFNSPSRPSIGRPDMSTPE